MQYQQNQPASWEAACRSLMDASLPTLQAIKPQPAAALNDGAEQQTIYNEPAPVQQNAVEVAPQAVEVPKPVTLNSLFSSYRSLNTEINRLVSAQQLLEKGLFGTSFTSNVRCEDIETITKSAIQQLIHRAEKDYAPAGGKLSISENEVMAALSLSDWAYNRRRYYEGNNKEVEEIVDLVKVQEYLEATYGGDAGIRRGLQQAAAVIISQFNLRSEESVVRTKSGVVLSTSLYSTKKDYGSNKGKYEVYHSAHDKRLPLFQALETFFEHAELHKLAHYGWSRSELMHYSFCFTPREKRTAPGLEISFFQKEWKFKFGPDEAEKLMLFLGEYGQVD